MTPSGLASRARCERVTPTPVLPPDTFDAAPLPAPQAQGIYNAAWAAYQRNRDAVTRGRALVGGLSALPLLAAWLLHEMTGSYGMVLKWTGYIGSSLVFAWLMTGLTHLTIKIARGEEGSASDIFTQGARAPAWAVTAFLHGLAVSAGLLLIVPGLLLQQRLRFAEQFAVARDLGPFEALEASWRVTRMQGWGLFKIGLLDEWNFMSRTSLLRSGVDAHGASEVESAVLYLVYEARLFPDAESPDAEIPVEEAAVEALHAGQPGVAAAAPAPPAQGSPRTFPCPRCGGPVGETRAHDYSVFPCGACGGVWVDNVVSQRLVRAYEGNAVFAAEEASRFAVRPVDTRPAVACPACGMALQRVVAAGIEIDACPQHGTWFDRDELPRVVRAFARPPEPIAVRTGPNSLGENLANAGGLAAENFSFGKRTAFDIFLDMIANIRISIPDSSWEDRDHDGEARGGWFGSSDSSNEHHDDHHHHSSTNDNAWCNDNDNSNSCNDNDSDGGHHH